MSSDLTSSHPFVLFLNSPTFFIVETTFRIYTLFVDKEVLIFFRPNFCQLFRGRVRVRGVWACLKLGSLGHEIGFFLIPGGHRTFLFTLSEINDTPIRYSISYLQGDA